MKLTSLIAFALSLSAAAFAESGSKIVMPTVSGAQAKASVAGRNPTIIYHGGSVMGTNASQSVNVYYIYYGNWAGTDPGGPGLMASFMSNLGGTPFWNILTSYKQKSGAYIHNNLKLAGSSTDTGSQGSNLNDNSLVTVVESAISSGKLPLDPNGIYEVVTSKEVNETSGFCSAYCGFHGNTTYQGTNIKYAFIGNAEHCTQQGGVADCNGEASNNNQSPNNDPGVDEMISVISHETEEATSDPDGTGWYFRSGSENGDQCAYTYGNTFPVGNGSVANITLGGKNYLIQQDFIAPAVGCALSH